MSTQVQTQTKAAAQPSFVAAPIGLLRRKCACGQYTIAGDECSECRQKREGMMQRTAVSAASVDSVPPIVHDVLSSPGRPLDAGTQAFMEPRFGYDFSQVRVHAAQRQITEDVGDAYCDPDKGKVVYQLNYEKIPICMWDCVEEHEKAHVKFMQPECSRLSAAIKASEKANAKAKGSKSETDLREAEKALEKAEKASSTYDEWFMSTCKANEQQAYQAGINECKKPKVPMQCDDLRETKRYTDIMKQWEDFKKKPPNCPEPAKEEKKEKTSEPKKSEPEKPKQSEKTPGK
jgi:Domain of unknown function (DUF4157)